MLEQFTKTVTDLNTQIEALRKQAADTIKPLLQNFMQENVGVTGLRWAQYTPYFNDGEPCTFRVGELEFSFAQPAEPTSETEEDEDEDEEDSDFTDLPYDYNAEYHADFRAKCSPELYARCKALSDAFNKCEDFMEALFGDHVQVIVTADGVEIEEYNHD